MDAVLCQARLKRGPEAEAAVGLDAVMSQAEAEAETAVGLDAVMSQAEAEAGSSGDGCCDEPG